jgi:ABC-type amino acid transport substrate-binding protein
MVKEWIYSGCWLSKSVAQLKSSTYHGSVRLDCLPVEVDARSNISVSDERQQFAYFVGPQHMEKIVAIVDKKLSAHLNKPIDLINFSGTIGKTQGTNYGKELENIIASPEVQNNLLNITSNANRVVMLDGRFDAILEEESAAKHLYDIGGV